MNRRVVLVSVQGIVSIVLLGLLWRSLDLAAFRALFVRLPVWFYLVSLLVVLAGQVAYAWRWRLLLVAAGVHAPFSAVVRQYFIGIFLNNFFPSTVGGDVAKVYLLGRDYGYRAVTASVLLDRMLGIGLVASYAALSLWLLPMPAPGLVTARLALTALALLSAGALVLAFTGTGGLAARVAWLGPRAVAAAEHLQRFRSDMAACLARPVLIAQAAAIVIGYFLAAGAVYVGFIAIQTGHSPSFVATTAVMMAASALSNIPISLNGLGLREQLHAVFMAPLGVPREVAVAISLLFFGHLLVASVLGFVFWLHTPVLPADAPARLGS